MKLLKNIWVPQGFMMLQNNHSKMRFTTLFFLLFSLTTFAQRPDEVAAVVKFQKKMNQDFRSPEHSPLPPKERKIFKELEFFPIDTSFIITAEFLRTPYESPFRMKTTTERQPVYVKYGEVYFELEGKEHKLNVYQSQELKRDPKYKDYLFLPFTDPTNGISTYAGGRYLDMKIPKGKSVVLNFNKAYNPYCAYSGEYSCPIPPEENDLDIPITAGVKAYEK